MKRSFYISLQTSCNEMLFCGIFISILNHINDSPSWRIRWGKKKTNPDQFAASSAIAWRLCLRISQTPSVAMAGEGSCGRAGNSGCSTSHSTATVPRQTIGKDHPKQLQRAVNKLQRNLGREISIWHCWLYHLHL